ncbi:hypothetical protein EVAR_8430_1 [Eumeta japonica]|uniref:Transposase n=1 Tax=Eumeta variegata TaxID=151549 RepID=A0A4C1WEC3_EUMVA|nr:hypothetical protein EVAR_8430_1 [Eumeta japonica]
MIKKKQSWASKAVYFNVYTGDESWIYVYDPETKQQLTVWVFQDEPNPTKVIRAIIISDRDHPPGSGAGRHTRSSSTRCFRSTRRDCYSVKARITYSRRGSFSVGRAVVAACADIDGRYLHCVRL